jgi:hypothetical protein
VQWQAEIQSLTADAALGRAVRESGLLAIVRGFLADCEGQPAAVIAVEYDEWRHAMQTALAALPEGPPPPSPRTD